MMYKKAQVESQFNWVFILIVGVLILALFSGVVLKMKSASDAKVAGMITKQLNTIFTGAGMSPGTAQLISIPRARVDFTCSDYYVGPASQRLGNSVVFSPSYITGTSLITWTLDWNIPFKVKNFLYVSGPFVRYIFYEPPPSAKKLVEDFPTIFNAENVSSLGGLDDENDDKIRVIFFVDPASLTLDIPAWFGSSDVSAVWINTGGAEKNATFYYFDDGDFNRYNPTEPAVAFYDDSTHSMLYGAMFVENPEDYKCTLDKAVAKAELVGNIYLKKYEELFSVFKNTNCESFYSGAMGDMSAIIAAVTTDRFFRLSSAVTTFQSRNTLVQLNSCPMLY